MEITGQERCNTEERKKHGRKLRRSSGSREIDGEASFD
jgi:hypothetical protein